MQPILADSHVHFDRYAPVEVTGMLARARAAGVRYFLAIGVDAASSASAAELAGREPDVHAAVGIHPARITAQSTVDALRRLLERPGVGAIGEVGLDDEPRAAPLPIQRAFFAACLDLAAEQSVAVALHVVGYHAEVQAMLAEHPGVRAVVHYFQGGPDLARAYVARGCWISVGKPVTRPGCVALRAAARTIPLDRLLLETDTYPLPGRTTEPRDVVEICQAVAELRGIPPAAVAEATTTSYLALFDRGGLHR